MKTFKGTNKDCQCRDFQFEAGNTYEQEGEIKPCENGFHSCEYPLDVFEYYSPNTSRYFDAECDGDIKSDGNKTASSKIRLNAEIGLKGIVQAAVKFTLDKVTWSKETSATGNCSGASATGYKSGASAGKGSIAMSVGGLSRAKGELGAYIVLTECQEVEGEWFVQNARCGKIDGEKLLPNTWYYLKDNDFTLTAEQDYQ